MSRHKKRTEKVKEKDLPIDNRINASYFTRVALLNAEIAAEKNKGKVLVRIDHRTEIMVHPHEVDKVLEKIKNKKNVE